MNDLVELERIEEEKNHRVSLVPTDILPIKYLEKAPSKNEIKKMSDVLQAEPIHPIVGFVTIKTLKEVCEDYIEARKNLVKEQIVKDFDGQSNVDAYGVKFQLRNKGNKETIKQYVFSKEVTDLEDELAKLDEERKELIELITSKKYQEINSDTAFRIAEEEDCLNNFTLVTTFRKE